jgi:hypothetical protein
MAHYAKIDDKNIVTEIIVATQDVINSGFFGDPNTWIQTSYNTHNGVHIDPMTLKLSEDQSKALRKNYAGIGYTYDPVRDAFIPPKPEGNFKLDEFSCCWVADEQPISE